MKKLTTENIRFIENYLKNSDVKYLDVRLEMTDHVASEIEDEMNHGDKREFYDIFKSYMVKNKAELMKNMKKFRRQADKRVLKLVFKNSYQPKVLFFFLVLIGTFFLIKDFIITHDAAFTFGFLGVMILICLSSYLLLKKNKFITVERLLCWFSFTTVIFFDDLDEVLSTTLGFIGFALMIWVYTAAVKTLYDQITYYRKRFLA